MQGTETIPALKTRAIESEYWKYGVLRKSEPQRTKEAPTKVDAEAATRAASKWAPLSLDRESRLWIEGIYGQRARPAMARIYLTLLQCLFQDPGANTSCILPSEDIALTGAPLETYLGQLATKGIITCDIRDTAYWLLEKLGSVFAGRLSVPDAAPGSDNSLMLAFDDGVNHLEFEILGRNTAEIYFLRRDTDEMWEDEVDEEGCLSEQVLAALGLFRK